MTQLGYSRQVKDVMTTNVHVVSEQADFKELVQLIHDNQISALPVVDLFGRVVGIVSEADLLLKEEHGLNGDGHRLFETGRTRAARAKARARVAGELMTAPVIVIGPQAPLSEAAHAMHAHGVKRLPVVDEGGRLVGIVSRSDLLQVFLRTDAEIRREVEEELVRKTLWLDPTDLRVTVSGGVVRFSGAVDRRSDSRLLKRLASQLEGVVDVSTDELSYQWDDQANAWLTPAAIGPRPPLLF